MTLASLRAAGPYAALRLRIGAPSLVTPAALKERSALRDALLLEAHAATVGSEGIASHRDVSVDTPLHEGRTTQRAVAYVHRTAIHVEPAGLALKDAPTEHLMQCISAQRTSPRRQWMRQGNA